MALLCLESQDCHLIPLSCFLFCFSALSSCSFCLVMFLLMVHSPDFCRENSQAFFVELDFFFFLFLFFFLFCFVLLLFGSYGMLVGGCSLPLWYLPLWYLPLWYLPLCIYITFFSICCFCPFRKKIFNLVSIK